MTPGSPSEPREPSASDRAPDRPDGTRPLPSPMPLPDEGSLAARALVTLRGDRSRAEVARAAGVSEEAWAHYESGKRSFTPEQRLPLARGLGVSLYELEYALWLERAAELRRLEGGEPPKLSAPGPGSPARLSTHLALKDAVDRIARGIKQLIDAHHELAGGPCAERKGS